MEKKNPIVSIYTKNHQLEDRMWEKNPTDNNNKKGKIFRKGI